MGPVVSNDLQLVVTISLTVISNKVWDDQLARVAQKWADQCADVDYKGDHKRRDPSLFHDSHPNRKIGRQH